MGKKSAPKDEALGGGLGLVNGMLGDLQKEFERSMKDSEDVMETLEVTSLAELKDKTEQIATSNKANAKAALEKATATASPSTMARRMRPRRTGGASAFPVA